LAKSAIDVLAPTFDHTQKQLFTPFRFGQWVRLALLGLATGELSTGGGCGNPFSFLQQSSVSPRSQHFAGGGELLRGLDPALVGTLLVVLVGSGVVMMIVWIFMSSISRFMLFESVVKKNCDLRGGWQRWQEPGLRYFWWQMGLSVLGLGIAIVLFFPVILSVLHSVRANQKPDFSVFLAVLPFFFLFAIFALVMLLVQVLTKDFVIPQMALERRGIIDSWGRLLSMMKDDVGGYAGYIGMKILLAMGAGIMFGIVSMMATVVVMIPVGIVGLVLFFVGKAVGLTFTLPVILISIALGLIAFAVLLYVIALVCVPLAVFFPAYALYFFADRYPPLNAVLNPAVPPAPPVVPPFAPAPQPIG
jgi:hypothetical protein